MKLLRSFLLSLAFLGDLCLSPLPVDSAELLNPSELSLKVISAEITNSPTICASEDGANALFAKPGSKLVRVVLEGKVTHSSPVVLPDAAFVAIFDKPDTKAKGAAMAAAMCLNQGLLIASSPAHYRQYLLTPGPISITLLFAIPEQVNLFQVTYPALAAGVASAGTKMATIH